LGKLSGSTQGYNLVLEFIEKRMQKKKRQKISEFEIVLICAMIDTL
jgi:hypothetical protein